jgi:4-hydroxy-3-methylbut-2-en-1-yl diphosphate reductase
MDGDPTKVSKKKYFESESIAYLSTTGEPAHSRRGRFTVYVARYYGFCHGVIRAIRLALDSSEKYAGKRLFLLGQIIHNPYVNDQLRQRGVTILPIPWEESLASITSDDVVIVPAFGISAATMLTLRSIGCTVVDTTCGEVMSIWKRIGRYNSSGVTTIIHGKYAHEETIATASRAQAYLAVKNIDEARVVADFVRRGDAASAPALLQRFSGAYSAGFDPVRDLVRVGMAAQTTMYSSEFMQVSNVIRDAILYRYGDPIDEHFHELDTICSATQERQDSVDALARRSDVTLIVGGYNSSNTGNLLHVAQQYGPAYHIQDVGQLNAMTIRHQPYAQKLEVTTSNWLPDKPSITIGMTSGASTPDSILEDVLNELLALDS